MAKSRTSTKLRSDRCIFVSLTPELKERLRAAAEADGRTMSQLVRRILIASFSETVQKRAA